MGALPPEPRRSGERVKRALDLAVAVPAALVLVPVIALLALAVRLESAGPVFFRQERIGRGGRPFSILKLRTLRDGAASGPADYLIGAGDARITRVGAFLRRWSLDELPQLWNIARGDMSLVGPRPTLRYQVEQYTPFQRRRLEVKPGVTGWAQVSGRNRLSWPERIELDVWYVDHRSFRLDLVILLKTFRILFQPGPVYGDDQGDWGERGGRSRERAGRHAGDAGAVGDVADDDRTRGDERVRSDANALDDDGAETDVGALAERHEPR
jgi:lipopolysaccharide/colanic/teichoic acid biosynthesis glycosyltransferase